MRDIGALALLGVLFSAWALLVAPEPGAPAVERAEREMVAPGYMPSNTPLEAPRAPRARPGFRTIPFDKLSYYDYDPEADVIPEDVLALDGKKIELIGVMYYGVEDPDRVTDFYLMPNHMVCCYGTFRTNEAVEVTLKPDRYTQYVLNYYLIRGTIHVGAMRDEEDRVICLYRITEAEAVVLE